jgi:replicative DNA helicase
VSTEHKGAPGATADGPRVIDRMVPSAIDSEHAVLGALLEDPQAIWKIRSTLKADDFWDPDNAEVYRAAVAVCDRGVAVDQVTLTAELRARGTFDQIGGRAFLSDLFQAVPTSAHVEHYAEQVMVAAYRRRLIDVNGKIAALAYDESVPMDQVRSGAWGLLTSVETGRRRNKPLNPEDQAALFWDMLRDIEEDRRTTIRTGIADLDRMTDGGLDRTQLAILMALPAMGKSAIGQSIGRFMGSRGHKVLFCSVEMNERQLIKRNAASLLRMDWHKFRRRWRHMHAEPDGGEALRQAVALATDQMQRSQMQIWYMPAMTTVDIRVEAMEMKATGGLDCIIVDYLQILADGDTDTKANRTQVVGQLARNLKRLAGELDVPVLALSQMSREYRTRENKRPVMSDARDSGEIEQHVDMLLGLYRDDFFYKPGEFIKTDKRICEAGKAELLVLKQREGPTGTCNLQWVPELCEYVSACDDDGRAEPWA